MYKINHTIYWLNLNKDFNKKVNLFADDFSEPPSDGINIFFSVEPQESISTKQRIISSSEKYDVILTYNEEILKSCKNAELFEFGETWIKNLSETENKRFEVSFLIGGKSGFSGHRLRHELWNVQDRIKIPKSFFNSSNFPCMTNTPSKILGSKKEPLFESQFHICIENTQEKGYFSEKLIDCLYTKTIPIYWGCPNISDYFNLDSIFIVNSLQEIIDVCNSLNSETYESKINSITENFEKSLKFIDISERIENRVTEILSRPEFL